MQLSNNTILITGGGSGIGRALAEAFHTRGNQLIIAGRRKEALDEVTAANPGMKSAVLDIADAHAIEGFAQQLKAEFPALNAVIHNAGIMQREDVLSDDMLGVAEATVVTNLLGPIRLTAALLSHLVTQPQATIMTVSSGLAFIPSAGFASYNATKAAVHSYTQSLRYQLQDTPVGVIELIPPYVQTELTGSAQATDPHAMPLGDFIAETMNILETTPDVAEIIVERVKPQRYAEAGGNYDAFFKQLNDTLSGRNP